MKKLYIIMLLFTSLFLGMVEAFSQNISVNTSGAANSTLSMFEVLQLSTTANTKGIHISHSGTIAGTGYGIWAEKTGGAGTTNIAGYFTVSGAGTNYPGVFMGGNVGIGTATPGSKLSFNNLNDGTNGADGITWYNPSPTSYGIFRTAGAWAGPNYQQLSLAWQTGITIDGGSLYGLSGTVLQPGAGNVGIGITTPRTKLHLARASTTLALLKSTVANQGMTISSNYTAGADYAPGIVWSSEDNNPTIVKAGIFSRFTGSGSYLHFGTSNNYGAGITNDAMVIDYNGNVGVATTAPTAKLHVNAGDIGVGRIDGGDVTPYARFGLSNGWEQYLANNAYYNSSTSQWNFVNAGGYGGLASTMNQISGTINFQTTSGGVNPITWNSRMYIANSGNVGIGTTGPSEILHVRKDQNAKTRFRLSNLTAGTSATTELYFERADANIISVGIGDPSYANTAYPVDFRGAYIWTGAAQGITLRTDGAGSPIRFTTLVGGAVPTEAMRVAPEGYVGINTTAPTNRLHVAGSSGTTTYSTTDNGTNGRALGGNVIAAAGTGSAYGVLGITNQDGTGGFGGGAGVAGANSAANGRGITGCGNGLNAVPTIPGNVGAGGTFLGLRYGIYSITSNTTGSGTGYSLGTSYASILSESSVTSGSYNFGVHGTSASTTGLRVGGVLGSRPAGGAWGALGYRDSGGSGYGLYYTSAATGAGRYAGPREIAGIGMGGYGDLMGGWIKGNVYGMNVKGDRYSMYVDGKTYTNDVIAQLSSNENSNERTVTYVPTSTSVDVYAKGTVSMSNGKAIIRFDEKFRNMISEENLPVITVTPMGSSQGVYIESVNANGFTVLENSNGNSTVLLSWIAIGTKKGYENPSNPVELLSPVYDADMNEFMFNENNLEGAAKPIWWDGSKLRFGELPSSLFNEQVPEKKFGILDSSLNFLR